MTLWEAPFTKGQVAALEEYQQNSDAPYMCGTEGHKPLIPTESGWYCKGGLGWRNRCDYEQVWAHEVLVTLRHELIGTDLVSHISYSDDPDDPYGSIVIHNRHEAADRAISTFVTYLKQLAVEERASRWQVPGRADDLDWLVERLAGLV